MRLNKNVQTILWVKCEQKERIVFYWFKYVPNNGLPDRAFAYIIVLPGDCLSRGSPVQIMRITSLGIHI